VTFGVRGVWLAGLHRATATRAFSNRMHYDQMHNSHNPSSCLHTQRTFLSHWDSSECPCQPAAFISPTPPLNQSWVALAWQIVSLALWR